MGGKAGQAGRAPTRTTDRYVGLLRGINVGGKHRLPMAELREIFGRIGCTDVRTYIQSGNVAFSASPALAQRLPAQVSDAVYQQFGFRAPVVVRAAAELAALPGANSFLSAGNDPKALHVAFLKDTPTRTALQSLDPARSAPDEFRVQGSNIFLYCPNGVARTKLTTAYFDKRLDTVATMRNWRTVLTLIEMTA